MIKKITIKRKTSSEIKTKKGPATKVGLLVESKNGDMWINGFANPIVDGWKEGDSVSLEIFPTEYNGKTYWNFKAPNLLESILREIREVKALLVFKGPQPSPSSQEEEEPPLPEDEPFLDEEAPF